MNPLIKFGVIMVIALELTFIKSVTVNLIVIGVSSLLYLILHLRWRQWLWLCLLPALPGLGSWFSLMYFGTGDHVHMAWVMLSRVYAYLWLGGLFTLKLNDERDIFLATLEQRAHLSPTFVYALVGVLNCTFGILNCILKPFCLPFVGHRVWLRGWSVTALLKARNVPILRPSRLTDAIGSLLYAF